MCLVALALDQSARFPLVLASNRDEFHERPAARLAWWTPEPGAPEILSGRDLRAGGTWLGLNAAGRLALVTSVRRGPSKASQASDPHAQAPAPSRGEIVARWLLDDLPLERYWVQIALSGYEAFNLIAADFAKGECFYASSDTTLPRRLERGLYGVSNASLDTPWPKVEQLKRRLRESLGQTAAVDDAQALAMRLFDALADRHTAEDAALPHTGVPHDWEKLLSAAFIATPDGRYGTRCSTVVITERVKRQRITHVFERSFTPHSGVALMRHARVADWPPRYTAGEPAHSLKEVRSEVREWSDRSASAASAGPAKKPRARGVVKPPAVRVRVR